MTYMKMTLPTWACGNLRLPNSKNNAARHIPSVELGIRDDWTNELLAAVSSRLSSVSPDHSLGVEAVDAFRFDDGMQFVLIAVDAGLVLPLVAGSNHAKPPSPSQIATKAAAHAKQVCMKRETIVRRMGDCRRIVQAPVFANAGITYTDTVLAPRRIETRPDEPFAVHVGFEVLGPSLETAASGAVVKSPKDLERELRKLLPDQARRLAQVHRLAAHGALLETDGITIRAIAGRRLDLTDVVRSTMAGETLELPLNEDGMHFRAAALNGFFVVEWGFSPRVLVRRGVVEIGHVIPETLLASAAGRPVTAIVDHPFLCDGPVIGSAANSDPAECSFLEVVQPALFLRHGNDDRVEAFSIDDAT